MSERGFRCPDVVDVGRTVGSPCPAGEVVHLTAGYDLIVAGLVALVLIAIRRRRPLPFSVADASDSTDAAADALEPGFGSTQS